MKNAMKKLMSLVLVAMILVSAVPFAASADSIISVAIYQSVDGADVVINTTTSKLTIAEVCADNGIGAGEFEGAWVTSAEGKEYKKGFDEGYGETATLVKIRKAAAVTTVTCDNCGESYKKGEAHTCPTAPVVEPIKIVVKIGSSDNVVWSGEKLPANGEYTVVENLLTYCWNKDWANSYTYDHGWSTKQQANVALTAEIAAGDTLSVMLKAKTTSNNTTNNNTNNGNSINVNNGTTSNEPTGYTKFAYPVYLNIYTDTTVGSAKKTINITSGIAADGRVTLNEVKSLVANYYTAIKPAVGIQYDGLYPAQGNWVFDYVADEKYDTIDGLFDAAAENYVYINVMITNATAISSSSSNADSSNPKTGDEIFMAVTAMAVSASALALVFYFNKKRAY